VAPVDGASRRGDRGLSAKMNKYQKHLNNNHIT
jgi:hypothetical protein